MSAKRTTPKKAAAVRKPPAAKSPTVSQASDRPAVGDLVAYRHRDPVTGDQLSGHGVVVRSSKAGAVRVAPLTVHHVDVVVEDLHRATPADVATDQG